MANFLKNMKMQQTSDLFQVSLIRISKLVLSLSAYQISWAFHSWKKLAGTLLLLGVLGNVVLRVQAHCSIKLL